MKKLTKSLLIISALLLVLSGCSTVTKLGVGNSSIETLDVWKKVSGVITPRVSSSTVQIPALASAGLCVSTNASGTLSTAACGGIAASSTWGTIIGTLSDQTDLQTALDAKLSTTTAAATYQPIGSYLTSETDPVYATSTWFSTTNNSSNWDTAYGWGDHATAGYLSTTTAASTYYLQTNPSGYITSSALSSYTPTSRTLTINGTAYDLTSDRSWTIGGSGATTTINSVIGPVFTFNTGTSGSDFTIATSSATITFNIPTASASNRGLLSTTDWSTFNNKLSSLSGALLTTGATTGATSQNQLFTNSILIGATASSTDWSTAKVVGSQADSAHSYTGNIGVVGESVASASDTGTGVGGVSVTNGANESRGVTGVGKVGATGDTAKANGVYGYVNGIHAGGDNIGVRGSAINGANNYAFYGENGKIYSSGDIELGHLTDTTLHRVSAGLISIEGKTILTTDNIEDSIIDGHTTIAPSGNAVFDALALKAPLTSPTFATSINGSYLTASQILGTDGSKNIVSLAVATYPSLSELAFVKGVTSGIQSQLNAKGTGNGDMLLGTAQSVTETKTFTKDKLLIKGTSTGTTNITTANTSATSYTATLPAKDGTIAMTTDIVSQVEDSIVDGHTTTAPSGNAVFDALALKSNLAGGNTFTGSQTFDTNTLYVDSVNHRIGIGTPTPGTTLEVVKANQDLTQNVGGDAQVNIAAMTSDAWAIDKGGAIGMGGRFYEDGSQALFGAISARKETAGDGNASGYLSLYTFESGLQERLRIASNGNVGIATVNPAERFDVLGTAIQFGADLGAPSLRTNSTEKVGFLTLPHYTNAEESIQMFYGYSDGSVSNINIGGGASSYNSATKISFFTSANNTTVSGTERMTIDLNGKIGIGTSTPSEILHVIGNGLFSGTLIASNLSGTNTGNESTSTIGTLIHGSTATTTPAEADEFGIWGSVTSSLQRITWANIKTAITSYISTVTATFTNKRITPRVGTIATSTSLTIDSDSYDQYNVTALAAALTVNAPSGSPTPGQKLILGITSDATPRALTFATSSNAFAFSSDLAAPTTTVASKTMYLGFIWNSTASKWILMALLNNI